jgi:hypothetical protein
LREERHAVRGKTIALHEHYAQLLEHSTVAMERLAQLIPYIHSCRETPGRKPDAPHRQGCEEKACLMQRGWIFPP